MREVIAAAGEPAAIGVGVPSQIDYSTGTVETSVNIPLTGVPLREELGRRFGVPVFVDNDANVAALGEAQLVGGGCENLVMLTLGTGVGGGVIVGGRIFRGAHGLGAELGHVTLNPDGPPCPGNCPNNGCVEAYCSGQALERDATELARDKPETELARRWAGRQGVGRDRRRGRARRPGRAAPVRPLRPHARRGDRRFRERIRARAPRAGRRRVARVGALPRARRARGRRARAAGAASPSRDRARQGRRRRWHDRGGGTRGAGDSADSTGTIPSRPKAANDHQHRQP